jgi:hypothetical protein
MDTSRCGVYVTPCRPVTTGTAITSVLEILPRKSPCQTFRGFALFGLRQHRQRLTPWRRKGSLRRCARPAISCKPSSRQT